MATRWRRRRRLLPSAAETTDGLDHVLAQAAELLWRARSNQDSLEVQRILRWIDARLDERLRLTRRKARPFPL
jgi:hypothetical protein